jgi:hypothetical protein
MINKFRKIIAIFLLISIIGIVAPNPKPAEADLIEGIFEFIGDMFGFLCDILEAIDDVLSLGGLAPWSGLVGIGDFCDMLDDLEEMAEQNSKKYPQPAVTIQFLDDFSGGINGEEAKPMVRAVAQPSGFKMESDSFENLYITWSVDNDYKYNAYLAGGEIENRWGTLRKDGNVYDREGGEGYDKWKEKYGVTSGTEDTDNDGFSAPFGGPNGIGNKCALMDADAGDVLELDCATMGHEFSNLVASCPDGTTGVIGDGVYNACEEYTWGTDPTKASTMGESDINDEMKMAGVGGIDFFYYVEDVPSFNPQVTVVVEGTTIRPVEEKNSYHYIMQAQNTKYPYEDDDYLNVDIEITPDNPQANGIFTATTQFVKQEPTDRDVLNYRWRFWRKDDDPDDPNNLQEGFGLDQMDFPGPNYAALTEGTYYVELQVCNVENSTRVCGQFKRKQINVGGQSSLIIEGLVYDSTASVITDGDFTPISVLLPRDFVKVTAECFIDPALTDPTLGCDATGYSYVWDISVGSVENGRKITSAWDASQEIDLSTQPTDISLINSPEILFEVPDNSTELTISVDGVGNDNQDLKIEDVFFTIAEPTIDIVINSGGQKDPGRTDRGEAYAGQDVELEGITGPAGSTFEILGETGNASYQWKLANIYGNSKIFKFRAGTLENVNYVVTVSAHNIGNLHQLTPTEKLVLEVTGSSVAGAFTWRKAPQYLINRIKNLSDGYWFWFIFGAIFIIPFAYAIGVKIRKKGGVGGMK